MRSNPRRTDPLLVFAAVKKMAPSWVRAWRGVGADVTMSVWACGCPGVPAYGCVGVCFFLCSYLFVSHCSNNSGTVPLTLVTARHDRIHSHTFEYFW